MALRARLNAANEYRTEWPWHKADSTVLPSSVLWGGERRMEAGTYLASGYGLRQAFGAILGSKIFADQADVFLPGRLKGTPVSEEFGTPFLAATQVFDLRPVPRKFLSLNHTEAASSRFSDLGSILVTRSGTVGRATITTNSTKGMLLSDDLLRVVPKHEGRTGWIYGYLRSQKVRSMMGAAKYGHIIKHLEPAHLGALPMPVPKEEVARKLDDEVSHILRCRNDAFEKMLFAERLYEDRVGLPEISVAFTGFTVNASAFSLGRRRLEGAFHNPNVVALKSHFKASGLTTQSLQDIGFDTWLPTRFRRIPAAEGVQLLGSAGLFEINPDLEKRIADGNFGDRNKGRAKAGWLLLARSGQIYGINGCLALANRFHEDKVLSDHIIRIAPTEMCNARAGYVYTALSHPLLGRPLLKALAYGSSIPEIEVADVAQLQIPRLEDQLENAISDAAEEGAKLFAEADILETKLAQTVDEMLGDLMSGSYTYFLVASDK
jgi:hypothetical protein